MWMAHFVPCSSCERHIRASEAECPFCGASLDFAPLPARAPRPNIRRAALIALGTALAGAPLGCGDTDEDGGSGGAADASAGSGGAAGASGSGGASGSTGAGGSSGAAGSGGSSGAGASGGSSGAGASGGSSGAGAGGVAGNAGSSAGAAGIAPPYGGPPPLPEEP
jgi:hypothetical protein